MFDQILVGFYFNVFILVIYMYRCEEVLGYVGCNPALKFVILIEKKSNQI